MITQKDIELLKETFVTKDDLKDQLSQLKSDIFEKIDKILVMFTKADQEQTILSSKVTEYTDTLEAHEERINRLEHRPILS